MVEPTPLVDAPTPISIEKIKLPVDKHTLIDGHFPPTHIATGSPLLRHRFGTCYRLIPVGDTPPYEDLPPLKSAKNSFNHS
jgi:hypothetical protein